MKFSDVWYRLYVGDIDVTDNGTYLYRPKLEQDAQLTTTRPKQLEEYRQVLHEMLDKSIDRLIEEIQIREGGVLNDSSERS